MRIASEHLLAHVAGDCHDRLVGNLRLGELSDRMVSEIVKAQPREWAPDVLDRSAAIPSHALLNWRLQFAT